MDNYDMDPNRQEDQVPEPVATPQPVDSGHIAHIGEAGLKKKKKKKKKTQPEGIG
ncbi:MAG: hypothetical protein HKN13_08950, partial [Rhodothermales bacterium]|nr:hypothetical protein [Rhodothermales bacterium]